MKDKTKNAINILQIYKDPKTGTWMYDDEELGVYREPFVLGSGSVIDHIVGECIRFNALFSSSPIPNYDAKLVNIDREDSKDFPGWYRLDGTNMEHWLCKELLSYFPEYPKEIFIRTEKL